MSFRVVFRLVSCLGLVVALLGGLAGQPARAQKPSLPDEGSLNRLYDSSRADFLSLRKGERPLDEKKDAELLDKVARYYIWRVAVFTRTANPKAMYEVVDEFQRLMAETAGGPKKGKEDKDTHEKFLNLLGRQLVKNFRSLLKLDAKAFGDAKRFRMMLVHACLMLEPLGRVGQKEVSDFLVGLVKDGPGDLLRLYALKGLRESFQARRPEVFDFTPDPEREATVARIGPVLDFLARAPTKGAAEEEKAAAGFVRREAVKALAETRLSSVPFLDGKTIKAPVAFALLRVLAGDKGMAPPPSLSERLEAAFGLCQMKNEVQANRTVSVKCQPDLIVGLVGKTLGELVQEYKADHPRFTLKGEGKLPPALPWKYYAERMRQSLKDLQANLPANSAARKNAQALEKAAGPLLALMVSHKGADDLGPLLDAIRQLPRPTANVYEGVEEHRIEIGQWPPVEG